MDCFEERAVTSFWSFCLRELLSAGVCYGVVLISWNGVVLKCLRAIAYLVVAAEFNEGKERVAADRLLLNTSIDFNESAGEDLRVVPEKSNAIVGAVTTGYECLSPSCDGLTGPDDHGPMISRLIDRGVSGNLAGQSVSSADRSPRP
ncbi:U-box domain-containing protein 17-like [Dorcoceras hygrometricum]|uniref:U-box domain-containing protein 17-like n=1 Tax=Dorcoceras hygrometricum TaxID=472368 RepID=A0A2Z7A9P9_9LAMI|nr:U-box domain-containing protein 17-like [Dorcoceras hygrometricum]